MLFIFASAGSIVEAAYQFSQSDDKNGTNAVSACQYPRKRFKNASREQDAGLAQPVADDQMARYQFSGEGPRLSRFPN
jgi:hypothetical protein